MRRREKDERKNRVSKYRGRRALKSGRIEKEIYGSDWRGLTVGLEIRIGYVVEAAHLGRRRQLDVTPHRDHDAMGIQCAEEIVATA